LPHSPRWPGRCLSSPRRERHKGPYQAVRHARHSRPQPRPVHLRRDRRRTPRRPHCGLRQLSTPRSSQAERCRSWESFAFEDGTITAVLHRKNGGGWSIWPDRQRHREVQGNRRNNHCARHPPHAHLQLQTLSPPRRRGHHRGRSRRSPCGPRAGKRRPRLCSTGSSIGGQVRPSRGRVEPRCLDERGVDRDVASGLVGGLPCGVRQ
jgi:hypothetical protein